MTNRIFRAIFLVALAVMLTVSCLIMGIAYALLIYVFPEAQNALTDILTLILPAGVLFWYALLQKKVYKNFW